MSFENVFDRNLLSAIGGIELPQEERLTVSITGNTCGRTCDVGPCY